MATFRERINEALALRNMTQKELANKTKLSPPRINQYVNGIYEPKSEAVYVIAKTLNVSIPWLMGYDVPMDQKLTQQEIRLLEYYRRLNALGKAKVDDNINDLSRINDYTEREEDDGKS